MTIILNDVVDNLDSMLRRLLGSRVELAVRLDPAAGRVRGSVGQIEQVLMNLVLNARDAMLGGGKLTIETSAIQLDEALARRHSGIRPGPYALLAVRDTGSGMDAAVQAHLFEPYFTTKPEGQGTGLGLATVWEIVHQQGGTVQVSSRLGQGTTFTVYLPQQAEPVPTSNPSSLQGEEARPESRSAPPAGAWSPDRAPTAGPRETVLITEDHDAIRWIVSEVLQRDGYHVLVAKDGEEALRLSEQHAGPINLLVTDFTMPHMNGRQLVERLQPLRPGMKVLFLSGHAENVAGSEGLSGQPAPFLQKPFLPEVLTRKVRDVLDN